MGLSGMSEAQRSECPLERIVIPHGGYRTIVADPPWRYGKWGKASVAPRGTAVELSHRLVGRPRRARRGGKRMKHIEVGRQAIDDLCKARAVIAAVEGEK